MYYKVIKNSKVIDVLDKLVYLRYQKKHNRMVLCDESKAQAFFSSDRKMIWHTETLYDLPVNAPQYDVVELVEIDAYEYAQLKMFGYKSLSEVLDEYTLLLIKEGII